MCCISLEHAGSHKSMISGIILLPWRARLVAACAIGLAVWALRVALIGDLGTGIPYMDQWYREGLVVYEPWLQGRLPWRVIFEPHLEHRIVWTNLWNLGLLELCGQWEPMVQMVAQAGITAVTAAFCVWILLPAQTEWYWRAAVLAGAVLAFGASLAYENILWGFQSQFGFFVMLSLLGCAATARAWQHGRYAGLALVAGLAAPLAMGAGALVGPIIVILAILVMASERKVSSRSGGMLAIGMVCLFWGLLLRSDSPSTVYAHAKSFGQFLRVWAAAGAWPNSPIPWLAALACLPIILLTVQILRKGVRPQDHELFICGVFFWAMASAAGGAWLRGALGPVLPARYRDILALLCWVNGLALVMVLSHWWEQGKRRYRFLGVGIAMAWSCFAIYGGAKVLDHFSKVDRPAWQKSSAEQFEEANSILEGLADSGFAVSKPGKGFFPPEKVLASRVLAPFLPPEIQVPFKGITPINAFAVGQADANQWVWQSECFEAKVKAMIMFVRGDGKELQLMLENQTNGSRMEFAPSGRRIGDLSEWLVRTTPGRYRVCIRTGAVKGELVVTLPRPLSIASYWVRKGAAEGVRLVEFAGICLAVAWWVTRNRPDVAGNIARTNCRSAGFCS